MDLNLLALHRAATAGVDGSAAVVCADGSQHGRLVVRRPVALVQALVTAVARNDEFAAVVRTHRHRTYGVIACALYHHGDTALEVDLRRRAAALHAFLAVAAVGNEIYRAGATDVHRLAAGDVHAVLVVARAGARKRGVGVGAVNDDVGVLHQPQAGAHRATVV